MNEFLDSFIKYLSAHNFSKRSLETYELELKYFLKWLELESISELYLITCETLIKYQNYLTRTISKITKKHLSQKTQSQKLLIVKEFFKFLTKTDIILFNPSLKIKLPRKQKNIRWTLLTKKDIIKLLSAPNLNDPIGFRDRAILEILYSSGVRATELCNLKISDIDYENNLIRIIAGKGNKDRNIPVCQRALDFVKKYINKYRKSKFDFLFVSYTGKQMTRNEITQRIHCYAEKIEFNKSVSAQCFRIACATHMLKNKADIRYVQQMLGHNDIDTTLKYLFLEKSELKQVHNLSHPHEIRINP